MNKRDYEKQLKQCNQIIESLHASIRPEVKRLEDEKKELHYKFRNECKHPQENLRMETNSYDDEYGRTMESWTDYDYECQRCGVKLKKIKNKFKTIDALQSAISIEAGK